MLNLTSPSLGRKILRNKGRVRDFQQEWPLINYLLSATRSGFKLYAVKPFQIDFRVVLKPTSEKSRTFNIWKDLIYPKISWTNHGLHCNLFWWDDETKPQLHPPSLGLGKIFMPDHNTNTCQGIKCMSGYNMHAGA